jgi:hypothetical protein
MDESVYVFERRSATIEGMRRDAFDSVECPFDYRAELRQARYFLDAMVGKYCWEHRDEGYRALARQFGMSPAKLCGIVRNYRRGKGWSRALEWVGRLPGVHSPRYTRISSPDAQ